jgi:hypothetical protein
VQSHNPALAQELNAVFAEEEAATAQQGVAGLDTPKQPDLLPPVR